MNSKEEKQAQDKMDLLLKDAFKDKTLPEDFKDKVMAKVGAIHELPLPHPFYQTKWFVLSFASAAVVLLSVITILVLTTKHNQPVIPLEVGRAASAVKHPEDSPIVIIIPNLNEKIANRGPTPLEELIRVSDLIFTGEITKVKIEGDMAEGTIEIKTVLKGDKNIKTAVLKFLAQPTSCDSIVYQKGQEGIWLLKKSGGSKYPDRLRPYSLERLIKGIIELKPTEYFVELLKDKNTRLREETIKYLSGKPVPSEEVVPIIIPYLLDPKEWVNNRYLSAGWLSQLVNNPYQGVKVISVLIKVLDDIGTTDYERKGGRNAGIRHRVYVSAIRVAENQFGAKKGYFKNFHWQDLYGPDPYYQKQREEGRMGKMEDAEASLTKLKSWWEGLTELIVQEEIMEKDEETINRLIKQLNADEWRVREEASNGLIEIGTKDVQLYEKIFSLMEGLSKNKNTEPKVRMRAKEILKVLKTYNIEVIRKLRTDTAVLIELLRDERVAIRKNAHKRLIKLTGNDSIKFNAEAPEADREKSIAEWEKWYKRKEDK